MSLVARIARFVFRRIIPPNPDFEQEVDALHQRFEASNPISRYELVQALEGFATREPKTEKELVLLEAELFVLGERIQKSAICADVPHFVWRFLSDADIRFKEPEYAAAQTQALRDSIVELQLLHGTQQAHRADAG